MGDVLGKLERHLGIFPFLEFNPELSPGTNLPKIMRLIPNLPRILQIYNATVKIGADGTDDDVKVGICSESTITGVKDCCEKKLSRALSDDWKKNKVRPLTMDVIALLMKSCLVL